MIDNQGGQQLSIKYIDPLLIPLAKRVDIMVKYVFVKYYDQLGMRGWLERLYCDHMGAFNGFVEGKGEEKLGKESFINSFRETIASIKANGYIDSADPIPVGRSGIPLDGAHRIAASLYFNSNIKLYKSREKEFVYDYKFLLDRGLRRKYIDLAAVEYCRLVPNSFVAIVYPSAQGKDKEVEEIFSRWGSIFYRKDVSVRRAGACTLVRQIYSGESWLGCWENGFSGASSKAALCWQRPGVARVFVLESTVDRMLCAKEEVRNLFNIGKHSVHITDSQEQSIHLGQVLLNDTSIKFLNYALPKYFRSFAGFFDSYKSSLGGGRYNEEAYCIDGSSVLSVFGIRDSRDLDYLYHDCYSKLDAGSDVHSHNEEAKYYGKDIIDIIYDPEYFFHFENVKFVSIDLVRKMKLSRSEKKDRSDIKEIDILLGSRKSRARIFSRQIWRCLSIRSIMLAIEVGKMRFNYFVAKLKNRIRM